MASPSAGSTSTFKIGHLTARLVNGVLGDPLLLVRLQYNRRCLLFDLGDAGKLRTRLAHDTTDVFVSHAHIDHVAGFLWLLRSRVGDFPPCRLYGPPGFAENVASLVAGIHWDRVGDRAPRFAIAEFDGKRVERFEVVAGRAAAEHTGGAAAPDGLVLADPLLRVRAALLDHRTPVVAYALEPNADIKVRKERLAALGLKPGPWLAQLKRAVATRETDAVLDLPNGDRRTAEDLAAELLLIRPGKKLVYATDLADTTANRERLVALAQGAHTLFCEAAFCEADAERAAATGHLTARACGEIATASGVERLIPFHFSRRYEDDRAKVYREVRAACARAIEPRVPA